MSCTLTITKRTSAQVNVVVRGGVEPPTFRFSGLRITVQDRPRKSNCLLSDLRYTPIDAGVRRCMRLRMRLRCAAGSLPIWRLGRPGDLGQQPSEVAPSRTRALRDRMKDPACAAERSEPRLLRMEIIELPPTRMDLSGDSDPVYIATQRWLLELWEGEDQPGLSRSWSIKPKFSVGGSRSCAELAVLYHLRDEGWQGIWVNAYNPPRLVSEWPPESGVKTIDQTAAPPWAAEVFDDLRAANGGKLGGFFDVFAWREPGEVRFDEVKVSRDPIGLNQRKFVKLALDLHHHLDEFTIIKVPG
jgi:hypothetical protein